MNGPVLELAVYKVLDDAAFDAIQASARPHIEMLPGLRRLTHLSDGSIRTDMVEWDSLADAKAASAVIMSAPAFAAFRGAITQIITFTHFPLPATPAGARPGAGVEMGRFRLKPGVSAATMVAAYERMRDNHLSRLDGWQGQWLVDLGDGRFVDLAFANSQPRAEEICAAWASVPVCDDFLALIEAEEMLFGSVAR